MESFSPLSNTTAIRRMIRFKKYSIWLFVNFGFCLLPLGISWTIIGQLNNNIFSSFIAYSFTLIISSLYLFDRYRTPDNILEKLSWFFVLVLLAFYIMYPTSMNNNFTNTVSSNLITVASVVLAMTFLICLLLNIPGIESEIDKASAESPYKKAEKTQNRTEEMMSQLKEEGNGND